MKIFWRILAVILGLFLAKFFIPGVKIFVIPSKSSYFGIKFSQDWQIVIFLGIVLGLIFTFLRPILKLITLPLRILTLGLFTFILNLVILWILDLVFPELKFESFFSIFLTTLLILVLETLFTK